MAARALEAGREILAAAEFTHDALGSRPARRRAKLGIKAGQMFEPIRVAVCGRKTAPPLFATLEVLGREPACERIGQAIEKLTSHASKLFEQILRRPSDRCPPAVPRISFATSSSKI